MTGRIRPLLLLLAAALPLAAVADQSAGGSAAERLALMHAAHSLVQVQARLPGRRIGVGTGVVVAAQTVATACHVVRGARRIAVIEAGQTYDAVGQRADPRHDVCLFQVPGLDTLPARLRDTAELEVGETVTAVGYSGGFGLQWQSGEVVSMHRFDGAVIVQCSAAFTSGASGGSLLDAEGRVVGLLSFRMRGAGAQFFALPVEWARSAGARDFEPLDTGFDAAPFWDATPEAMPFFMQANSLQTEGRDEALRQLCERWDEREPGNAEPAFLRAGIDQREGRVADALAALDEALARDPTHAPARLQRLRLRLAVHDADGAREDYAVLLRVSAPLARRAAPALEN